MPLLRPPTTVSRSTTRVRRMTAAVAACIVIVAVASRPTVAGTSSALLAVTGFVFVLAAALEVAHALQTAGVTPALVRLP